MISYTSRYINIVSVIITILIFSIIMNSDLILKQSNFNPRFISNILKKNPVLVELKVDNINKEAEEENNPNNSLTINTKENQTKETKWKLMIPKIELEAEISEGTGKEIMDRYIGHFEETSKKSGNVGLAAHNRGYNVNYFAQIKKLKQGDEIIYKFNEFEKTYIVEKNIIIKDTDWNYLKETEENKITLITCVENQPEYRRCIQAKEKQ